MSSITWNLSDKNTLIHMSNLERKQSIKEVWLNILEPDQKLEATDG